MSLYRKGHQQTCDWNNYDHITQHKHFLLPDSYFFSSSGEDEAYRGLACAPQALHY